jgi:hypothetical protein
MSTTLLTGMTSISLHMQWPLTSQLHGSFLKENNCFLPRIKVHALLFLLCLLYIAVRGWRTNANEWRRGNWAVAKLWEQKSFRLTVFTNQRQK